MRFLAPALSLLLSLPAFASPSEHRPSNLLGVSPFGFAGFLRLNIGSYEIFYERLLSPRHSLRVAFDFIHVHQSANEDQSHQWTFGGSLTYRLAFSDGEGAFAGLRVGARRGFGHYGLPGSPEHTRLLNRQLSVVPQLGYRWWLGSSVSVVAHIGAGYGPYVVEDALGLARSDDFPIRFSRDALGVSPIALDTEISIAFAF